MTVRETLELDVSQALSDLQAIGDLLSGVVTGFSGELLAALELLAEQNVSVNVTAETTDVVLAVDEAAAAATPTVSVEADTAPMEEQIEGAGQKIPPVEPKVSVDPDGKGEMAFAAIAVQATAAAKAAEGASLSMGSMSGILARIPGPVAAVAAGFAVVAGACDSFFQAALAVQAGIYRLDSTLGVFASTVENLHVGDLNANMDDLARSLGSTPTKVRDAAANFAMLGTSAGYSQEQVAKSAAGLVALSARAVALKPSLGEMGDVMQRVQQSFSRGTQRLGLYGISLSTAEIQTKALEISHKRLASELSPFEKAMAGIQLATEKYGQTIQEAITEGTKNPQVAMAAMQQQIQKTKEELGQELIVPMFDLFRSALPAIQALMELFRDLGMAILPVLIAAFNIVGRVLMVLMAVIHPIILGFTTFVTVIKDILSAFNYIPAVIGAVVIAIKLMTIETIKATLALAASNPVILAIVALCFVLGLLAQAGEDTSSSQKNAAGAIGDTNDDLMEQATVAETTTKEWKALYGTLMGLVDANKDVEKSTKAIDAANRDVTKAEQAVTDAHKAQDAASRGIAAANRALEASHRGVEHAQKAQAAAERDVIQAQKDVQHAQQAVIDALKGVRDANRNVEEANRSYRDAVDNVEKAEHRRVDSIRSVIKAQKDLLDAENALKDAERGTSDKDQLAIDEAKLSLQRAQEKQAKSLSDASMTAEDKEEARIGLRRAQLDLQDAQATAAGRLKEAQDKVAESADSLTAAQDQAKDAEKGVSDAHIAVSDAAVRVTDANDAVAAAQRNLVDSSDRVVDAQQRVSDAQDKVVDAKQGVVDAYQAVTDAQQRVWDASDSYDAAGRRVQEADQGVIDSHDKVTDAQDRQTKSLFDLWAAQEAFNVAQTDPNNDPQKVIQAIDEQIAKNPQLKAQLEELKAKYVAYQEVAKKNPMKQEEENNPASKEFKSAWNFDNFKNGLREMVDAPFGTLQRAGSAVAEWWTNEIAPFLGKAGNWFSDRWTNFTNVMGGVGNWFGARWEDFKRGLAGVGSWFGDCWNTFTTAMGAVGSWFGNRWEDFKTGLGEIGSWFSDRWTNFTNAMGAVGGWFGDRWEDFKKGLSEVGSWFGDRWTNFTNAMGAVGGWFGDRWTDFKNGLGDIGKWFSDRWDDFKRAIGNVGQWFSDRWTEFTNGLGNIGKWFSDRWDDFTKSFSNIGHWFGEQWDNFLNGLGDVASTLVGKGKEIIKGLIQGMINALGLLPGIGDKAKEILEKAFNNAFEIKSPSRVMMRIGEQIAAGVGVGIENGISGVADSAHKMVKAAQATVDSSVLTATLVSKVESPNNLPLAKGQDAAQKQPQPLVGNLTVQVNAAAGMTNKDAQMIGQEVASTLSSQLGAIQAEVLRA